jgi:TRAP-type uncharacterized transport system substrate-binding protein
MHVSHKKTHPRMVVALIETFGLSPTLAFLVTLLVSLAGLFGLVWVFQSAPPRVLTVTSGPNGSTFQRFADSYAKGLAAHGVTLRILPSEGSSENLHRLVSAAPGVDIGFVQGGLAEGVEVGSLISLGSIAYEPLWVFYRSPTPITRLAELAGHRLAIGPAGSGTRTLALALLKLNSVALDGPTTLLDLDAEAAAASLLAGKIDAVFLMGDSAPTQTLRNLLRSPDVQLLPFAQADAYARRLPYLSRMELPEGGVDLGTNLPAHDLVLIGPTVELVARKGLHPALSDLLLEVAQEVHGKAGRFQKPGEFPAALEHEFALSDDALRYYKSGKSLMYRTIGSFWLASLLNRILVVFVPALLVIIPAVRFLPFAYRWRIQLRIYRCYRPLLALEREVTTPLTPEREKELHHRLNEIEAAVGRLRIPPSFADQFYNLRNHIAFVRSRLKVTAPR